MQSLLDTHIRIWSVSAMKEEATMARLFPRTYTEYRRHTSMLIPFVL